MLLKRRFTAFSALVFFIISALPNLAAASFSDVSATHIHATAINTLQEAGVIKGYSDGTFKPDSSVNRAESLAIILKAAGIAAEKTSDPLPFSDVPEGEWFFPMVQKGFWMGKVKGYGDKTFRPGASITLPEALALTLSFFNVSTANIKVDPVIYSGLESNQWYAPYAQYAKDNRIIAPSEDGMMRPEVPLTRGQLAEIIYRMKKVKETNAPFDITMNWVTTENADNHWKIRHPEGWELFKGLKNSVLWKRDQHQAFFTRLWPKSGRLSISLIESPENTSVHYFNEIKEAYAAEYKDAVFTNSILGSKSALLVDIPSERLYEAYIYINGTTSLTVSADVGKSAYGIFLKEILEDVIKSYEYMDKPVTPPPSTEPLADRLASLRENILVKEGWKETANLFPDKKIIHTDAIGVGTGPVDYYYTLEANHTIKVERNSSTILNIKEGQTNGF